MSCLQSHFSHTDDLKPGTSKDLNLVLNKSYEVLRENNKVIVQIIKKIEEIKSGIEIEHDALKKCFQEIKTLELQPS